MSIIPEMCRAGSSGVTTPLLFVAKVVASGKLSKIKKQVAHGRVFPIENANVALIVAQKIPV
jgi:hypothetical protein